MSDLGGVSGGVGQGALTLGKAAQMFSSGVNSIIAWFLRMNFYEWCFLLGFVVLLFAALGLYSKYKRDLLGSNRKY